MTLARRISLMVSLVIGVTSLSIAILAAYSGRSSSLSQVDERLTGLRDAARASDDPVRAVLQSLDATPSDLIAHLQVDSETPISLLDDVLAEATPTFTALTEAELRAAERSPVTRDDGADVRLFSVALGEGQWLVVGEPVDDIATQFQSQLVTNSLFALLLAILGGLLAALLARRTFAPLRSIVNYSVSVASGRLDATLDADAPSSEVRELQTSIGSMVASLRDAAERRARSEVDMREFLADVAHELRTPLTTVRAYADVLATTTSADPEVRGRAQERIAQESKRMSRLIDDLLLIARLASTRLSHTSTFDMGEVVRDHFADLQVLDPDRPVEIDCTACEVEGDRALIERMFANLAGNIHHHTPPTARVVVSCAGKDDVIICSIDDAGPGLDEPRLRELALGAQRFGQLRSGDRHGSGLGLHLVMSIAKSHGGVATFEPSRLGGLRVCVTLPKSVTHSR